MLSDIRKWLVVAVVGWGLAACAGQATPEGGLVVPNGDNTPVVGDNTPAATVTPLAVPTAAEGATATGAAAAPQQWPAPPEMSINPDRFYFATLKTDKGDIVVELLADKAPITVNNFVFLARQGYYDNTTFHRVLDNFMAQGGDPTGSGSGGPGYRFQDEFHPDLSFDGPGLLAMANAGPGTNGSQFFITYVATPHLNGKHTIFGRVLTGMEVALALTRRDPNTRPTFDGDRLQTVLIEEGAESRLPPATEAPPPTPTPTPYAPTPAAGRPLAQLPFAERENLFNQPPEMVIDPAKSYTARIETTAGDMVVQLYAAEAPQAVNNFVVLAELGYWDEFPFVAVQPGEVAITGSPAGQPSSDIGYSLAPETERLNVAGSVGLWYRADINAASGSQVYFLLIDAPSMDGRFGVFGEIVEGLEVAQALTMEDHIFRITIEEE